MISQSSAVVTHSWKGKGDPISNEQTKNDLIGQVRTIRAYRYFVMNWWYGGVPVIDNYNSADEAKVPRKSEEEVKITSIQNWTQPSVN